MYRVLELRVKRFRVYFSGFRKQLIFGNGLLAILVFASGMWAGFGDSKRMRLCRASGAGFGVGCDHVRPSP